MRDMFYKGHPYWGKPKLSTMRQLIKRPESLTDEIIGGIFSSLGFRGAMSVAMDRLGGLAGVTFDTCDYSSCVTLVDRLVHLDENNVVVLERVANDRNICDVCDACGSRGYNREFTTVYGGGRFCENCFDESCVERNGTWYHHDDDPGEDEDEEDNTSIIQDSSTNVLRTNRKHFCTTAKDKVKHPLFLGIELEAIPRDGWRRNDVARQALQELRDIALLKYDGSVEGGFEICSVPGTLEWHRSGVWDQFFEGAAKKLKSYGTGVCGMHIHIDRKALGAKDSVGTSLTIGKMLMFINDQRNRRFIEEVAGRSAQTYCQVHRKKLTSKQQDSRHYDALSFSRHGTMELRIFRGNVSKKGFFRNLEFTAALCEWAGSTSTRDLEYRDFLAWFRKTLAWSRYRIFAEWLKTSQELREIPIRESRLPEAA